MFEQVIMQIKKLLNSANIPDVSCITRPPKPEMGDFAFPCFNLAKEQKKNPAEVAKELASKIIFKNGGLVERVQAFGPYVNFFLDTGELAELVVKEVEKKREKYGENKIGKGKKVMIEYPSNNTHKEFHIGHLRNACIGNTLVNIYRKSGYKVVSVNYLNDFGAHVARCLWGLQKFHANETPPENKHKWLAQIYVEASQYLMKHEDVKPEIDSVLQKLEAHDSEIWDLYMETRKWSIDGFGKLFEELKVEHNNVFYEKDVKATGHGIVAELLKKKVAEVGERGAIIINLEKYGLDVALLRKADGTGLYLTSDLPLAYAKFGKYNVDESITITGQEQSFYFRQLFKILELIGFKKKMTHIGYGLVNLPEGKMSSRTGNVILYEDLRDVIFDQMLKEAKSRHNDWCEEKIVETAKILTMAALKFTIQKHESNKNITFDMAEATSFDGFSGPYVLYVVARINSILRKNKGQGARSKLKINFGLLKAPGEKKLLLTMAMFEDVVKKALENNNPSVIAKYSFDLAQAFNEFYNLHSVLNAESQELAAARVALSMAVKGVLENALSVLSINTVLEM